MDRVKYQSQLYLLVTNGRKQWDTVRTQLDPCFILIRRHQL